MERPEDVEWCCGAVCESNRKLDYINFLEGRVTFLENALKLEVEKNLYEKEASR